MSRQLISRNADLKRLQDEGYELEVRGPFLVVGHVPYLDSNRALQHGVLVSELALAGDVTAAPTDHTVYFGGSHPCDRNGNPLDLVADTNVRTSEGIQTTFRFSRKPEGGYADHHHKMTTYVAMLSGPAQVLYPESTATTFLVIEEVAEESVFVYRDTATSRAGISEISKRLELGKVAIVGLGGTGAYILDFLAKTPIRQIHLYDGDRFVSHNAFRSPGAASLDELRALPTKVEYLTAMYSKMRRQIIPHGYLDENNVDTLREMGFVFLALDKGEPKRMVVTKLLEFGVPFTDVGMGVYEVDQVSHRRESTDQRVRGMTRVSELRYEFVRLIPEDLTPGTLYISVEYATASHLCCCGCGFEVVTPLSPTDWKLTFDGESVSLHPSIGNWAFACQSHYWINRNRIQWAGRMTPEEIAVGRELDRRAKREQFGEAQPTEAEREPRPGLLGRLRQRVRRAQSRPPEND
jgi:hypothetical protein